MNIIWTINLALGKIFDLVLAPFAGLDPFWGLALVSAVTGGIMVAIFKFISNQEGIRKAKAKLRGYFLEVWIYKHEFSTVIGSVGRILKANLNYMRYAVSPLVVMIIPVVLIMVHLNFYYGMRSFKVDEQAVVTVKWDNAKILRDTTLTAVTSSGLSVETKPVRSLGKNEVTWRVRGIEPGIHMLTFKWSGGEITKTITIASDRVTRLSSVRSSSTSIFDAIFNPGEKPLDSKSSAVSISVNYPETTMKVLGIKMHWIIVFFILSIAAGFVFKGIFKVEI